MENKKPSSRKKFILGVGVLSVLGAFLRPFQSRKDIISCGPSPDTKKKIMLTEDGKLVEIDEKRVTGTGRKITDKGLQSWIKRS
jgi:hypothetical protein